MKSIADRSEQGPRVKRYKTFLTCEMIEVVYPSDDSKCEIFRII